jgi:hypothetical protein
MTPKQFARFVARDGGCVHCGETEAIAPNHRINRGAGGSKRRDNPANIVVLCSQLNALIESDSGWRSKALTYGWKLNSWDDPLFVPVFDVLRGVWWRLDDSFGRVVVGWDDSPF